LAYLSERQGTPEPHVDAAASEYLTHLAVRRQVSASTQNQALFAILFLCREVLALDVGNVSLAVRAKRRPHLPVVLSVPETQALLRALRGTTWLMATLIYGGGLRVTECCQLRVKDIDFDQGLLVVRSGKGDKDRTTLLAETCRDRLRIQLRAAEAIHQRDRRSGSPACGCRTPSIASSHRRDASSRGSGSSPAIRCRPTRGQESCGDTT
jgi:integrase